MQNNRIQKIVIVGGGTAGWMVAAGLCHYLKKSATQITLIEAPEIGSVGVGEATIPSIRRFYAALGLDDLHVIKATQATCKLGIEFTDWHQLGHSFFHPFGLFGQSVKNVQFYHFWLKLRGQTDVGDLSEYSLASMLAKSKKFTFPAANPSSPLSIFDWALHFDAGLFAQLMKKVAIGNRVDLIEDKILSVNLRKEDGFIESVSMASGEKVESDLFIDCSGFKGLLIEEALNTGYEDWSAWLLCDRAVAVQSQSQEIKAPYTRSQAGKAGWQWQIPLQHRNGNGHVYASQYLSEDEATNNLMDNLEGSALTQVRSFRFVPGMRKQAWNKNCIAVGLAAGFIEPLESTSIALIENTIERIKLLFPDKSFDKCVIEEFNTMSRLEYERVRDFIILHYKASQREDSEFWRYCKNMAIPDTLEHKLNVFKARGHLVKYRWEIFQNPSWIAMYNGFNVWPDNYDPMVDNYEDDYLIQTFNQMRKSIRDAVATTQTHDEFIAQYCTAHAKDTAAK